MAEFLHDLNIHGAGHIQFKTAAGANAGKIDQDGNNLVLTNAVGDILLGDGASDVYIGDGTNNVDIIFEQSGSIKGDGSAVTLTLGGANTTLNLENPNINGNFSVAGTGEFEGNVIINTPSANSNGQGLTINRPAAGTHYASVEFATNGTVDWSVGTNSTDAFEVYENGTAATTRFSIAEGGNATFSGTVTANGTVLTGDQTLPTDFVSAANGGTFSGSLEIGYQSNTSTTAGTTFLELDNNVGGDISQQQTFIDFKFTDTNANHTPQVRIGAQVGPDADANAISKEGAGSFVVYTAPVGSDESGNSTGLAEAFRVSYDKSSTFAGRILNTYAGTSYHELINATSNGTVLQLRSTGDNRYLYLQTDHIYSNGSLYIGNNSYQTNFRGSSYNFENGNATFAGDILLSAAGSTGEIIRTTDNTEPYFALQRNSGSNGVGVLRLLDGGDLAFDTGATGAGQATRLTIDGATGNATFAGDVHIGSGSPNGVLDIHASNGNWRVNDYGGMYFRNSSNSTHESYIHPRSDGSLSIGRVAESDWTSSGTGTHASTSYDHLRFDTSSHAIFAGSITLSGNITNTTGNLIIQNNAGAQLDIKSNQGVRLYIDKNNDDTTRNFEILANTDTYNANNVVATVSQLGNATFSGTVTANGTVLTGATSLAGLATESYVDTAVSNLIDSAPSNLNTLNELAEALNDDDDAIVTINTALGNRVRVDTASQGLTNTQKSNARTNIGAQAAGSYITGTGSLSAQDLTDIGNLSGTNTGDQDLSAYLTSTDANNYLKSNANDSFSGQLTGTGTSENLKVGGIRGTTKGSQTGEYIHLYNRVHIGGPNGWGASSHGAPNQGLSTWGSVDFGMNGSGVIQLDGTTVLTAARALQNVSWSGDIIPEAKLQNQSGTNTGDNSANSHSSIFIDRGSINVTTASGGSNSNPFDNAHTETKLAENGTRQIVYTGASAALFSLNIGGSASVLQLGSHYNGDDFYMRVRTDSSSWKDWRKLHHDNYHPNADKWTTARTLSLTGEVTGSVSWDGSGNASLATTLNNSSLDDQYVTVGSRHSGDGSALSAASRASIRIWDVSEASDDPTGASDGLVLTAGWDSNSWAVQQYHDFHSNDLYLRSKQNGTWMTTWDKVFHDTYHPNADTLTTARTLTIGGTGKTFNGSANVSWTLAEIGAAPSSVVNQSDFVSAANGGTFSGNVNVFPNASTGTFRVGRYSGQEFKLHSTDLTNTITSIQDADENQAHDFILNREHAGSGDNNFRIQKDGSDQLTINKDGLVSIAGNLTVHGTQTILNTRTVEVEDNILQLNTTQGSPDTATATTSGISVYRGNGVTQASFIFDDADDTWDLTNNLAVAGSLSSGDITIEDATPALVLKDSNNGAGGGAHARVLFSNTGGKAIGIGTTSDDTTSTDLYISSNAGSTYGGYLLLDSAGISDAQADIIIDPKTSFKVFTAGTLALTLNTSQNATFAGNINFGDSHFIGDDADDNLLIQGSSSENVIIRSEDGLYFRTGGNNTRLTINSSGNATFNGNIIAEDSEVHVGDTSGDSWTRILHAQADGYGFDWQHNNATVLVNEQGSTNQALVLGDVDAGDVDGLFGIAHKTASTSWAKVLNLKGNGELYIGSAGTSQVYHEGHKPTLTELGAQAAGSYAAAAHNHAASEITSGTFIASRIPNLAASKITSGTFANARISEGSVTQHVTGITSTQSQKLGYITVTQAVNLDTIETNATSGANALPLAGGTMGSDATITGTDSLIIKADTQILFRGDAGSNIASIKTVNTNYDIIELLDNNRMRWRDGMDVYLDDSAATDYMMFTSSEGNHALHQFGGYEFQGTGLATIMKMGGAINNTNIELYYNNVKQLETTSTGISTNTIDASVAAASAAGNFVVMDGTRLAYRTASQVLSDIGAGSNNFDGAYSSLTGITSASTFAGTAAQADQWSTSRQLTLNGDVSGNVLWDGSGNVTLTCTVANDSHSHSNYISSNSDDTVTGHTEWQDNKQIRLGNDSDLRLYHNASNSYIDNYKGHLYIRNNVDNDDGGNIYIQAKSGEQGIIIEDDSAVSLYNNNSKKLETTSAGVTVSGNISVTGTTDGVDLSEYPTLPNQLTYQTLVAHFSQTSGSSSTFNIPMNNTTESTTATYYHSWTPPFDGQVKTMIMKHSHGTTPSLVSSTPTKFRVAVNGTSADYTSSSFLTRVRVEGRSDDYYSYIKDDNINQAFSAGDRVYFQFLNSSSSVLWRNCSVSIVVEYNIT